jgi:hypothetical protein
LIEIVSDWGPEEVADAQRAFARRRERAEAWQAMKERYAGNFARLAELWHG